MKGGKGMKVGDRKRNGRRKGECKGEEEGEKVKKIRRN